MNAVYYHVGNSPYPSGPDYQVCLKIVFDPDGAEPTVFNAECDQGVTHFCARSGKDDGGNWITVFPDGNGTSKEERAHLGCCALARDFGTRMGVDVEQITYGGRVTP